MFVFACPYTLPLAWCVVSQLSWSGMQASKQRRTAVVLIAREDRHDAAPCLAQA